MNQIWVITLLACVPKNLLHIGKLIEQSVMMSENVLCGRCIFSRYSNKNLVFLFLK